MTADIVHVDLRSYVIALAHNVNLYTFQISIQA